MEIMKSLVDQDISDIKNIKDNLFLNCPQCNLHAIYLLTKNILII